MARKGARGLGCPEARKDSVSGRKEWGAVACHRGVKQGAARRPPHLATPADTGALRGTGRTPRDPGRLPKSGNTVCTQGPVTGAAAVLFSVTHGPLAPGRTARLLPCCTREPRTSWGWVLCSLSPGLLAERRESV